MIIPSIDLMGGQTVQLVGGREKALDAGDPRPIAEKFGIAGIGTPEDDLNLFLA